MDHPIEWGPWVELRQERCSGGRVLTVAVNCRDGRAAYLSADEAAFVREAGRRSAAGTSAPPGADELVESLYECGFLATRPRGLDLPRPPRRCYDAILEHARTLDVQWTGADRLARRCYHAGGHLAFGRCALAAQVVLAFAGLVATMSLVRSGHRFELRAAPWQVPLIIAVDLVAVAVHELGHALVLVRHGRRVRAAGVRLHLGTPAFYVDALEALLLTRRQRVVQALAGPWAEWQVTAVVALVVTLSGAHIGALGVVLFRFVILNSFTIATNLLPFVGLDGHWLLADGIGQPDLALRSREAPARILGGERSLAQLALAGYAALNASVAVTLTVAAAFFWYQLFGSLLGSLARAGLIGLAAGGVLLAAALVPVLSPRLVALGRGVHRVLARLRFRLERRWRVDAVLHLHALPIFADLGPADLGVLAGRLQRRRIRRDDSVHLTGAGAVYLRRGRLLGTDHQLDRGDSTTLRAGGQHFTCMRRAVLVVAPGSAAMRC